MSIYGIHEAQKNVTFESFPAVLNLQLNRFQYNPLADSYTKINDTFEFFEVIELDDFLEKKESTPAKYLLHAVLVHTGGGGGSGGHYVAFINPKLDANWFKFDDDVVSCCSKDDAINANFGDNESERFAFRHSTSAYKLVYVRDSFKNVVLSDMSKSDIPDQLQKRLAWEERQENKRNQPHLYMQVNAILEKEFYKNGGFSDLYNPKKVEATKYISIRPFILNQTVFNTYPFL
jgi:ubiquitin carboxyl-terminal hydrolase 7